MKRFERAIPGRRARLRIPALALLAASAVLLGGPAFARDVEIRGTLLCRDAHDPLRERPADLPCLLVRADAYPRVVELIESPGLFRLRLPSSVADRPLVLRVFHGPQEIHAFRFHVEPNRFVRSGDVDVLSVGSHLLPMACEDLVCSLDVGLAGREQLLADAPAQSQTRRNLATFLTPVLLLVPGALIAGESGGFNAQISPVGGDYDLVPPGTWPEFARASGSPAIGRSLTSPRHPEETALWNPSALALASSSGISGGAGSMNSPRMSAWISTPDSWRGKLPIEPRVVSAGATRYSLNGTVGFGPNEVALDLEEEVFVAGLGLGIGSRVGISGSYRRHEIHDEIEDRSGPRLSQKIDDFDLAATVDATHWLRLAVAGYALSGETIDVGLNPDSYTPRTYVAAAAVSRGLLHAGVETSVDDDGAHVAAGVSLQLFSALFLDVGGGSRDEAIQMGLESGFGPARIGFRVRQDELDAFQHYAYLTLFH
jgi:hypothetical protein